MLRLALSSLLRRRLRNTLTIAALSVSIAVLASLSSFSMGYKRALLTELNGMGMQLMVVPLGCPYDASARVLKGKSLENTLPESALAHVRSDPAVAVAAPMLIIAAPRPEERRVDMWVGLDETALEVKPWWRPRLGRSWFSNSNSVILGAEASMIEMREPGDKLFSSEGNRSLTVDGVLERSGTADDSLFFIPLATAQAIFNQPGRLTAIAIRLRDPQLLREAADRLQAIPGAQVVTLTEMMGAFLNLVGSVRMLVQAIAIVAVTVSALGVFNTLLASVLERVEELAVMRAVGASRPQIFALLTLESLIISSIGAGIGLAMAASTGGWLESVVRKWVPLAPEGSFWSLTPGNVSQTLIVGISIAVLAGCYPAWRASRIHPANALKGEA